MNQSVYLNKAYIALGTNMGNWKNNFNRAILQISKIGSITNFSAVYISKPYGYSKQNDFYNMAIELKTSLSPMRLIQAMELIEKKIKKNKVIKNGPRTIDLDIILYNKIVLKKKSLIIPHPRAHIRDFVLLPICEMNPFYIHPIIRKTMIEIYTNLQEKFVFKKIKLQKENLLIF